jgi:hypothetical protein
MFISFVVEFLQQKTDLKALCLFGIGLSTQQIVLPVTALGW